MLLYILRITIARWRTCQEIMMFVEMCQLSIFFFNARHVVQNPGTAKHWRAEFCHSFSHASLSHSTSFHGEFLEILIVRNHHRREGINKRILWLLKIFFNTVIGSKLSEILLFEDLVFARWVVTNKCSIMIQKRSPMKRFSPV